MKKVVDNVLKYAYKLILIFTIGVFAIALIGAVFFYVNRSYDYLNPIVLIIGSIIYLLVMIKLYRFIMKLSNKKKRIICVILLILQFILLFISTQVISSIPQVDLIHILTEINSLHHTGELVNSTYFSVYPNNNFLLMVLYGISKISYQNMDILFSLFSSACITIMSLFTYKTVKLVGGNDKALMSLLVCVASPIFYLYVSYCYTDVLMLPFASILVYLMIKNSLTDKMKMNIWYGILIGMVAIVGYKIRAVLIFLLLAYFMYLVFKKKFKFLIKCLIPIMISAVLCMVGIGKLEDKFFTDTDATKQFPMTHWIMMGVNLENNGYYAQTDYDLSASAKDVSERQEINIEMIKERVSKQGIVGNTKLVVSKIVSVWSKGDYSYQKYLELVKDNNWSYRYLLEDKNIVINYVLQFAKIAILILCIASLVILFKRDEKSMIAIALFIAVCFYLIWEVCPRYGLSFLPWMILLTNYSYDSFDSNLKKFKGFKWLKYVLVAATIVVLGIGFFKYANVDERSNFVTQNTVNKIKYMTLDKDTDITQSLKLNSDFNEIKLKFRLNEEDNDTTYKLELLDDKDDVVYEEYFKVDDLKDQKYTRFVLDKTYQEGNYTIRLSVDDESALEVYIAYKEEFDYYPNGVLKVNEKEEAGDLMFEIKNTQDRAIFSYIEYIGLVILVLGIEYVVLFKKEMEVNEEK